MEKTEKNAFAIILNYNTAEESIKLFSCLKAFKYNNLGIIIIDNASEKDDIAKLRSEIPAQNLIFNQKNLGYARGNNVGIEYAVKKNAMYIWILNPDIRVEKETFTRLQETLEQDPSLAAVGPRILRREDPTLIFTDGEILLMDKKCATSQKNFNKPANFNSAKLDYEIDYIDGSCIMLRAEAIKILGKFPEEYFLYFEETDWCTNARKHGWSLAVNTSALAYNLTSVKRDTFHYYFMRNKLIFSKKYHPHYSQVRDYYSKDLLLDFFKRITGDSSKPFLEARIKGFLAGVWFNLNN